MKYMSGFKQISEQIVFSGKLYGKETLASYYHHLKKACENSIDTSIHAISIEWQAQEVTEIIYLDPSPSQNIIKDVMIECDNPVIKKYMRDCFVVTIQPILSKNQTRLSTHGVRDCFQFSVDPEVDSPNGKFVKEQLSEYKRSILTDSK